ncbi:hypothetical protein ATKI12_6365 [Kitasatospora sp. Ki12]
MPHQAAFASLWPVVRFPGPEVIQSRRHAPFPAAGEPQ